MLTCIARMLCACGGKNRRFSIDCGGSGLIGYGQLSIIKLNDTYLSAYGYKTSLLVKEGDKTGVTRERVRQIQLNALKILRAMIESHGISGDVILD